MEQPLPDTSVKPVLASVPTAVDAALFCLGIMLVRSAFHHRKSDGKIVDAVHDLTLADFAGFLPNVGDWILEPGVPTGLDRQDPKNRNIWVVVQRMFNPRDMENGVALIVEDQKPTPNEYDLLPSG